MQQPQLDKQYNKLSTSLKYLFFGTCIRLIIIYYLYSSTKGAKIENKLLNLSLISEFNYLELYHKKNLLLLET